MIVIKIILAIVIISAFVAFIAFIFDQLEQSKNRKSNAKKHEYYGLYEQFIKRPLDCFLATGALIVFSPILIITTIIVKNKLGSPVLFSQDRPGLMGKVFKLYKFRSMTDERDENGELLPNEVRLTSFGKKLRSTSIDELPELLNIIKGDMAIIGPRPLLVRYLPYYTEEEKRRHDVRPGLTGLAQVTNNGDLGWDDKLAVDVSYAENITFIGDVSVIFKTIKAVFTRGDTAYDSFDPLDIERMKKRDEAGNRQ